MGDELRNGGIVFSALDIKKHETMGTVLFVSLKGLTRSTDIVLQSGEDGTEMVYFDKVTIHSFSGEKTGERSADAEQKARRVNE